MTDLTLEELAELERLFAVVARSMQDAATFRDACYLQSPALLAMARELVRLRAKALRVTHRDVTEDELAHVAGLAIDARNSLLTPGGSSAPIVRWLMWQEDRGLAVALELLTRNQDLVRIKSALAFIAATDTALIGRPFMTLSIEALAESLGWVDPTTLKAEG